MDAEGSGFVSAESVVIYDGQGKEDSCHCDQSALADDAAEGSEDDAHDGEVSVGEGGSHEAQGSHDGIETCCQEGHDDAVYEGAHHSALKAAGGVAADTCCGAAEEVDHCTGKDHGCCQTCSVHADQDQEGRMPPMKEAAKQIRTALGAKLNMMGQSRAGTALGTSFSEMPLKAGTISLMTRRTPARTT